MHARIYSLNCLAIHASTHNLRRDRPYTTDFFSFTNSPSTSSTTIFHFQSYLSSFKCFFIRCCLVGCMVGRSFSLFSRSLLPLSLSLYITSSSLFSKSNDVKNNSSKVYYLQYIVYMLLALFSITMCVWTMCYTIKKGYLTDRLTSRKAFLYRRYFHMNEYNFLFFSFSLLQVIVLSLLFFSIPLYFREYYYYLLYPKKASRRITNMIRNDNILHVYKSRIHTERTKAEKYLYSFFYSISKENRMTKS